MALRVKKMLVSIEGKQILKGVSLEIKAGEVVALMGPNGSGKSSLAQSLMGNPKYKFEGCVPSIELDGESLVGKSVDERAKMGLFLAFQYPVGIDGVNVKEILLTAIRSRGGKLSAFELRQVVEQEAKKMGIDKELLTRSLNDGFSGGEKKKMEMLQMNILKPKYAVLDETDSGLDIDALKIVAEGTKRLSKKGVGVLVITHYKRILEYLKPNRVLVMKNGKIVAQGGEELVKSLEKKGYKDL
jgi:Fe-S cluster assembly ATP-binding protein